MLESISWSEFLSAVAVLTLLYYVITGLFFYKVDLDHFFRNVLARPAGQGKGGEGASHSFSVMGPAKRIVDDKETPDDKEIIFAPDSPETESESSTSDAALVGVISDLGEEIKLLVPQVSKSSDAQIQNMFRILLGKYERVAATGYRLTINLLISETIAEHTEVKISAKEIDAWWTATSDTKHKK